MKSLLLLLLTFLFSSLTVFSQHKEPIFDVHLHAQQLWPSNPDTLWYPKQFRRPSSSEEIMRLTFIQMKRYNIVKAVTGGNFTTVKKWEEYIPNRLLPGFQTNDSLSQTDIEQLRQLIKSGKIKVLAEIQPQYSGIGPSDPAMEPLYNLAEEYDIPIGIHIGLGPSGAAMRGRYRSRLSSPLLLEEALVRHPRLRIYVMHAGWPMLDDMVAMLYAFPNLYVDIGVIDWYIPRAEFYTYLKRLVDAGFSKRIMYGSDQMQWPQAIGASIKAVADAPFLTKEQKRDIFYNNAARFFRLNEAAK